MNDIELIKFLRACLDTQTTTIRSLQEYVVALQHSHRMLAASRKLALPPPA